MKVYIAGKIKDNPHYFEDFFIAKTYLKSLGYKVYNPAYNNVIIMPDFDYDDYIHVGLAAIDVCEAVAFLPNWLVSKGANIEYDYACVNKKKIIFLRKEDLYVVN